MTATRPAASDSAAPRGEAEATSETRNPVSRPGATQSHDPDFPDGFRTFMRSGWRETPLDVASSAQAPTHARRRAALSSAFPGETLVIPSGGEKIRTNDTAFPFRPGSDHLWLTGERDPDAVLVMRPVADGHASTLYVHPRSSRDADEFFADRVYGELWIGRRHTLAEKTTALGVATERLDRLTGLLDQCAPGRTRVLRGLDAKVDELVRSADPARDRELAQVLAEFRLVKDEWEVARLVEAVDATVLGYEDVARAMPADRPVSERLLEGVFGLRARHDGNGVGYGSIVGSGDRAAILHWTRNDGTLHPGQLVLMDMGVECHDLYTADLTRTYPVSGRFTPIQREVYETVARAQLAGIEAVRPGAAFEEVHQACMRVLAEGLAELGVLPCGVDEAMDPERLYYRRWTLHGSGHMLGLDVHDCAASRPEAYRKGALREGYVLTVEPGLYFQPEDELVPAELRGIGVRIEDDVLVTSDGARVLSSGLPKAADDVERWLADQREAGPRLPG